MSFVLPTLVALKVVLTAAYLAFVLAAVAFPGFFGLAFQYGFYPFLKATEERARACD